MTSYWKKPSSSLRQQENNWINITFQAHDQFCVCDDPWKHLLHVLNKNGSAPKPEKDIDNIKCLLIGKPFTPEEEDTTNGDETGFYDGELEKLFQETGDDESATASTR